VRGELIQTTAADGLRLDGFLLPSAVNTTRCAVIMHGVGSNFYASSLLRHLAQVVSDRWGAALLVNSRGHDSVSHARTRGGVARGGAAFEDVGDGVLDVAAWTEWMQQRGFQTRAGIGHSLGAIKLLMAMASPTPPQLDLVVAVSPPRLHHPTLLGHRRSDVYQQALRAAGEAIEQGNSDQLLSVRFPFPMLIAPRVYLDKYGPQSRYDWAAWLPHLRVPHALIYGGAELSHGPPGLQGVDQVARSIESQSPRTQWVVPDADHAFETGREELGRTVVDWLLGH
jgi:hypothetical protein